MTKSTHIALFFFLFQFLGSVTLSALTADTLKDVTWELEGESGAFSPAGWASDEVMALTRVQAVRMGLIINDFIDERFDPVKGKVAALGYYNEDGEVEPLATFEFSGGHLLLEDIADEAGVTLRTIEASNPHLRRDILPAGAALYGTNLALDETKLAELSESQASYQEELEVQYERRRKQALSLTPNPDSYKMITYTVRSGDYLGKISANTGAKIEDIRKWNRISGNTIYAGQKLNVWVPISSTFEQPTEAVVAVPSEESSTEPSQAVLEVVVKDEASYITYEVKDGDTLWGIAQRFPGVSADNIKSWNEIDELIKAGEKLRINTQTISDYSPDKYPSTL